MDSTRVSDLTVEELLDLIRSAVRDVLQETHLGGQPGPGVSNPQLVILDIPPLQVDARHPALTIISREEMYDDDGR